MRGCSGCAWWLLSWPVVIIGLGWPWAVFHATWAVLAWWAIVLVGWCGLRHASHG